MIDQPTPDQILSKMLAALPQSEHGSLICGAGSTEVRADVILDGAWLSDQIRLRGLIWGIDDPFILNTLWWYSASNWLAFPMIASSFLTGTALSPRLDDVLLHHQADSRIPGSRSVRLANGDGTAELADALGTVIDRVAAIAGKGERRLWSIAVDAIAGRYLWAGRATGRVAEATRSAQELIARLPLSLPVPRFTEIEIAGVSGNRLRETFVRRGSCCLLYQVDDKDKCSTCPRQRPSERLVRLEDATRRRAS